MNETQVSSPRYTLEEVRMNVCVVRRKNPMGILFYFYFLDFSYLFF